MTTKRPQTKIELTKIKEQRFKELVKLSPELKDDVFASRLRVGRKTIAKWREKYAGVS